MMCFSTCISNSNCSSNKKLLKHDIESPVDLTFVSKRSFLVWILLSLPFLGVSYLFLNIKVWHKLIWEKLKIRERLPQKIFFFLIQYRFVFMLLLSYFFAFFTEHSRFFFSDQLKKNLFKKLIFLKIDTSYTNWAQLMPNAAMSSQTVSKCFEVSSVKHFVLLVFLIVPFSISKCNWTKKRCKSSCVFCESLVSCFLFEAQHFVKNQKTTSKNPEM